MKTGWQGYRPVRYLSGPARRKTVRPQTGDFPDTDAFKIGAWL